jgi:hypothetical protein
LRTGSLTMVADRGSTSSRSTPRSRTRLTLQAPPPTRGRGRRSRPPRPPGRHGWLPGRLRRRRHGWPPQGRARARVGPPGCRLARPQPRSRPGEPRGWPRRRTGRCNTRYRGRTKVAYSGKGVIEIISPVLVCLVPLAVIGDKLSPVAESLVWRTQGFMLDISDAFRHSVS